MATKFTKKQATDNAAKTGFASPAPGVVTSYAVKNPKSFDWGTVFTLEINGVEIHGCKVGERRDGNSFISFPSYKGKDGKWYSHVYFRLSDQDTDEILEELAAQLS